MNVISSSPDLENLTSVTTKIFSKKFPVVSDMRVCVVVYMLPPSLGGNNSYALFLILITNIGTIKSIVEKTSQNKNN